MKNLFSNVEIYRCIRSYIRLREEEDQKHVAWTSLHAMQHLSTHTSPEPVQSRSVSRPSTARPIRKPCLYSPLRTPPTSTSSSKVLPVTNPSMTILSTPLLKHQASHPLSITSPNTIPALKHTRAVGFAATSRSAQ